MTTKPTKTKDNTLYLPIEQVHFEAILNGTIDKEYRSIKPNSFKKYLETKEVEDGVYLFYIPELITEERLAVYANDFMYYNDGVFPYLPKDIAYLDVVNTKDGNTMTVEVTDISFEPGKDKNGNIAVISYDEEGRPYRDAQGDFTIWNIVFHLGEIVEKDLRKER